MLSLSNHLLSAIEYNEAEIKLLNIYLHYKKYKNDHDVEKNFKTGKTVSQILRLGVKNVVHRLNSLQSSSGLIKILTKFKPGDPVGVASHRFHELGDGVRNLELGVWHFSANVCFSRSKRLKLDEVVDVGHLSKGDDAAKVSHVVGCWHLVRADEKLGIVLSEGPECLRVYHAVGDVAFELRVEKSLVESVSFVVRLSQDQMKLSHTWKQILKGYSSVIK